MYTTEYSWEPDIENGFWGMFEVSFDAEPYIPAKTNGPSDSWSPAEGGYVDINSVKLVDLTAYFVDGQEFDTPKITDEIRSDMEKAFDAAISKNKNIREDVEETCKSSLSDEDDDYDEPDYD